MFYEVGIILSIIFKGMLIGIMASAPMGPVGVLCIQRTLNKGRWYGFVTGCGASLSDIFYALLTGFGMSFVFDYVNRHIFYLQLFGSILLFLFGFFIFRSTPKQSPRPVNGQKGTYLHNFATAFLVTLSNPLIIILFIGLFARFSFVEPGALVSQTVTGYLSIAGGSLLWWLGITWVVTKLRSKFDHAGITRLNRIIGMAVMTISVLGLFFTLRGQSLY